MLMPQYEFESQSTASTQIRCSTKSQSRLRVAAMLSQQVMLINHKETP